MNLEFTCMRKIPAPNSSPHCAARLADFLDKPSVLHFLETRYFFQEEKHHNMITPQMVPNNADE